MQTKILLDTDIGSDVDDAVCLAYLLNQPQCNLLGITTVTGDVVARASLADALCRRARHKVPIYPGLARPLLAPCRQPLVPQAKMLRRWPHAKRFPGHEAIGFLQRTIRAHPGEVVLLSIGPMTNIAALFTVDPELAALLKGLVMMGGNFAPVPWHPLPGAGRIEWNVWNDPHAAEIVYRAPVRLHRSIGVDVTRLVNLTPAEAKTQFRRPVLDVVYDLAKVWFAGGRSEITFHDPLAAVSIFHPEVCQYARGKVEVATEGLMEGYTLFHPEAQGAVEVAETVNPATFFEHYFAVFS